MSAIKKWTTSVAIMTICAATLAVLAAQQALAAEEPTLDLPVSRVVLFSSGVGYFEHTGTVEGDAVMRLRFKTDQINDVLKSMILMDMDGGTVRGVSYASNDPISRALGSFAIDLSDNPSPHEIVGRLRGTEVVVNAPNEVRGKVLNVEQRQKVSGEPPVTTTEFILHLVTDRGIRSIPMDSIDSLTFADEKLREELNGALALLMTSTDKDSRPVDIKFTGRGTRRVRIGYLVETPVWKTTYRLDLSGDKPFMQGWAITENTSDNDWTGVTLSLVSGRPISFIQDLYTPLYLDRPVVQPKLMAFLRPRLYGEGMAENERFAQLKEESSAGSRLGRMRDQAAGRPVAENQFFMGVPKSTPAAPALQAYAGAALALGDAVQAAAEAGSVGELFSYTLRQKIDLARRRSAMLPIINQNIEAERVSIYNQQTLAAHPLNGVYLTNSTDMKMLAGPVTVFDGNMYAGDAQIDHLSPGDKRLLSYAVDLSVTVDPSVTSSSTISLARIYQGVLQVQRVNRFEQTYAINNKGDVDRTIILEHPFVNGRKLVEPTSYEEKTPETYRFRVPVKAESAGKFLVREEQPHWESISIIDYPVDNLMYYVNSGEISKQVREALAKAVTLKNELTRLNQSFNDLTSQEQQIKQGQDRLRQNLASVGQNSELGKRYLRKLADEEDEIETLDKQIEKLRADIQSKQQELADYLKSLDIR